MLPRGFVFGKKGILIPLTRQHDPFSGVPESGEGSFEKDVTDLSMDFEEPT